MICTAVYTVFLKQCKKVFVVYAAVAVEVNGSEQICILELFLYHTLT